MVRTWLTEAAAVALIAVALFTFGPRQAYAPHLAAVSGTAGTASSQPGNTIWE